MTPLPQLQLAAQYHIDLRKITEPDTVFLQRLYRSTREQELLQVPWSEAEKQAFCQMQFDAQHCHYQTHYPDAQWLLIEQQGRPIGRLYLERWPKEHRIIDIALIPEARRQGIGAALLRDLQSAAATDGSRGIGIHVEKANPAMALYHRLGFATVEDKGVYDLLFWQPADARRPASVQTKTGQTETGKTASNLIAPVC